MTRFDAALIFEALAQGCPTVSAFISIHNMASWMIDALATTPSARNGCQNSAPWSYWRAIA